MTPRRHVPALVLERERAFHGGPARVGPVGCPPRLVAPEELEPGPIPGAIHHARDVFHVGQLVIWRTYRSDGPVVGTVRRVGRDVIRVRSESGLWAGNTELYRWFQWAPARIRPDRPAEPPLHIDPRGFWTVGNPFADRDHQHIPPPPCGPEDV